ncbi:STAS domain-containing protein [Streptosporangium sp. NBC_01756]|uniref:STAS domain-containing protein n=1 Tax=Streptosporangium sp. NBC_01756 TaxID=2975950 RepID=UPI002DD9178A|nr:STAS domain-containing protein [Streptosporangium sp. NBC_01756]WSC85715.1 STAS domain-containing protein [Streptosporangium sp. NBC_01756]
MDAISGTGSPVCALSYDDGTLRITPMVRPPGIRLEGELDRSRVAGLLTALAATAHLVAQGGGPCYVDLRGLDFIDVSGLRTLITAGLGTGAGGPDGIRMVAASAAVRRLLRLTGWDGMPEWDQAPDTCSEEGPPDADGRRVRAAARSHLH